MSIYKTDIYIPSINTIHPFNEINTLQQKGICKAALISHDIYCTEFLNSLVDVFSQNSNKLIVDELNIHDLLLIAIGLRIESIGLEIPLTITCSKCNKQHKYTIKLNELYSKIWKKNNFDKKIEDNNYIIEMSVPSIKKEIDIMYKLKTIAFTDEVDAIKKTFVLNIDRYITNIKNKSTGKYIELNNKYQFFDNLSIDLISQMLNSIQQLQMEYKLFDFKCNIENCTNTLCKTLNYDLDKFYFFLKLLFKSNVIEILKDEFYLQKIGVSLSYSDQLTHLERQIIWSFFNELEAKKKDVLKTTNNVEKQSRPGIPNYNRRSM